MSEPVEFICSESIGDEFTVVPLSLTFDDAEAVCGEINSTLARISSIEEHFFVLSTALQLKQELFGWIGVRAPPNEGSNVTAFEFTDNSTDSTEFLARKGEFPWAASEPFSDSKSCVSMRLELREENLWVGSSCDSFGKPICRRPCSNSPTQARTLAGGNGGGEVPGTRDDNGSAANSDGVLFVALGLVLVSLVGTIVFTAYILKEIRKLKNWYSEFGKLHGKDATNLAATA